MARDHLRSIGIRILCIIKFELLSVANEHTLTDPLLRVIEVVAGLSQPEAMAFIGSGDILVLQKGDGRVRRVINGALQPGEVLDVHVDNQSERALLGIALHPDSPARNFVYIYYTESSAAADTSGSPLANRGYRYACNGSVLINPHSFLICPPLPVPIMMVAR